MRSIKCIYTRLQWICKYIACICSIYANNKPFPSCCLPLVESNRVLVLNHSNNEFDFHEKIQLVSISVVCTCFETEANNNLEMGYWWLSSCSTFCWGFKNVGLKVFLHVFAMFLNQGKMFFEEFKINNSFACFNI